MQRYLFLWDWFSVLKNGGAYACVSVCGIEPHVIWINRPIHVDRVIMHPHNWLCGLCALMIRLCGSKNEKFDPNPFHNPLKLSTPRLIFYRETCKKNPNPLFPSISSSKQLPSLPPLCSILLFLRPRLLDLSSLSIELKDRRANRPKTKNLKPSNLCSSNPFALLRWMIKGPNPPALEYNRRFRIPLVCPLSSAPFPAVAAS